MVALTTSVPLAHAARRGDASEALFATDPTLDTVADERLRQLYEDTVLRLREVDATLGRAEQVHARERFVSTPKSSEDRDYLIAAANGALDSTPPDWNLYRVAIWAMKAGMQQDPRMVPLARRALTAPRGEKISDDHGRALEDTMAMLGQHRTAEAVALLEAGVSREFWGNDPMRSATLARHTEASLAKLRSRAVDGIAMAPGAISLPVLERLQEQYPDAPPQSAPTEEYRFEMGAGFHIAAKLYEVRRREGLPVGEPPQWQRDAAEQVMKATGMPLDMRVIRTGYDMHRAEYGEEKARQAEWKFGVENFGEERTREIFRELGITPPGE